MFLTPDGRTVGADGRPVDVPVVPNRPGAPGGPGASPRKSRRGLVIGVVVTVVLLAAAGVLGWWTFFREPEVPDPGAAAADLATALEQGDVSGVPLTTATSVVPAEQYTVVFEQLTAFVGDRGHTVTVSEVGPVIEGDEGARRTTATLQWSWPVTTDAAWEYITAVDLTWVPPEGDEETSEWTAAWEPTLLVPDLQAGERLAVETVAPVRGQILGAGSAPIVSEQTIYRVGIDKFNLGPDQWDSSARALAALMPQLDADGFAAEVAAAGEKAYVEAYPVRQGDTSHDLGAIRSVAGVLVREDTMPLAPTPEFARPILGRVGEATAEIIEESEGAIKQGDVVGLSGLQLRYDEQLRGAPGVAVTVQPADEAPEGTEPREVFAVAAADGTPLATTLDVDAQIRAEQVLAGVVPASAIVAIKPSTGEVVAAANGPGNEGQNFALTGQYAPGSTFKIVSALGMIRAGMSPSSIVPCTETITVNGRTYQNVPGYPATALGDIPLAKAFANSCNTAVISTGGAVSQQVLHDAAADLGLGVESPLGTGAYFGDVPAEESETGHAESMIGQGKVLASPLAMATVVASVSAGHRVSPILVPGQGEPPAAGGLTADEASTLRSLMGGVVSEGSAQNLQDVPGIVGAKTGTAEFVEDGVEKSHVWMVAITDYDLVVAVMVAEGERGSTVAGPLMHQFLVGS